MNYLVPLTCHYCRGALRHVNGTRHADSCEQTAIAECEACGREWLLLVQLRPIVQPESRRRRAHARRAAA